MTPQEQRRADKLTDRRNRQLPSESAIVELRLAQWRAVQDPYNPLARFGLLWPPMRFYVRHALEQLARDKTSRPAPAQQEGEDGKV